MYPARAAVEGTSYIGDGKSPVDPHAQPDARSQCNNISHETESALQRQRNQPLESQDGWDGSHSPLTRPILAHVREWVLYCWFQSYCCPMGSLFHPSLLGTQRRSAHWRRSSIAVVGVVGVHGQVTIFVFSY